MLNHQKEGDSLSFALIGILIGVVIGIILPYTYNTAYSLYISVAILASLDSILGGVKASLKNDFNSVIFISGFFINSLLAAFLAYVGDRLGVPLYYAAIFTFGGRLFDNIASIRRILIAKYNNRVKQ